MNHITIYGNLGGNPEIRTIGDKKKIAKFSVATSRRSKDKDGNKITDWHNVILWDKLAELAEEYLTKGSSVIIEGEVQYRNYENKEGVKVYITEIVGNQMHFVGKKETDRPAENKSSAMSDINELPGANEDDLRDLPFN